jgi:hypothetical protein
MSYLGKGFSLLPYVRPGLPRRSDCQARHAHPNTLMWARGRCRCDICAEHGKQRAMRWRWRRWYDKDYWTHDLPVVNPAQHRLAAKLSELSRSDLAALRRLGSNP